MSVTLIQRIPNFITSEKKPGIYELNSYEEFLDTELVKDCLHGHKDPCSVRIVRSPFYKSLHSDPSDKSYRWLALQIEYKGHTVYRVFGRLIGDAEWIKNISEAQW